MALAKLAVDFRSDRWLCRVQEDDMDVDDLIERLCTMAGMIMEDASVGAISRNVDVSDRVEALALAARKISALAGAAVAIVAGRD